MTRATSAVLALSGSMLLATWLATPATSSPQATRRAVPADAGLPPELDEMNAELSRLRSRLDARAEFPPPSRDPFNFAERRRANRSISKAPEPAADTAVTEEALVAWPTLVAILTSAADGSRQAAIADADDVLHVVSVGDKIGLVTVAEISAESVTLTDSISTRSHQLSVR